MSKNTSIALGEYFEEFVQMRIGEGKYKNASEVIRAGLRLLEVEEQKFYALKNAIQDGIDSGIAANFDHEQHLQELKRGKQENVKV
jgi:antitoxin ParD1/3/4